MDGLTLYVQSEYAGDVGHVAFSPEELAAFTVVDGSTYFCSRYKDIN
jgi:hypothetical protein